MIEQQSAKTPQNSMPTPPAHYAALTKMMINKGSIQQDMGDFNAARQTLLTANDMLSAHYPKDHLIFFPLYDSLIGLHITLGEYTLAEDYIEKSKRVLTQQAASNDLYYSWLYESIYTLKMRQGHFTEAKRYALKSLVLLKNYLPHNHPDIASTYQMLGDINSQLGDDEQAEKNYQQSIQHHQKAQNNLDNKTSPAMLAAMLKLVNFYLKQGQFKQARPLLETNISLINKHNYSPELLAQHFNALGKLEQHLGDYDQAEKQFNNALKLRQRYFTRSDHHALLDIKIHLAELAAERGDYAQANNAYSVIIVIQRKQLPNSQLHLQQSLNKQGVLLTQIGHYQQAESAFNESLAMVKKHYAVGHVKRLTIARNKATLALAQGNNTRAAALITKTLATAQQKLHPSHPMLATLQRQQATLQQHQGQYQRAQKNVQKVIQQTQRTYGVKHPKVARGMRHLAQLYSQVGDFNAAEKQALQALAITQHARQATHPDIAQSLSTLATIYAAHGNSKQAINVQQRALVINEAVYQSSHPVIGIAYRQLAQLFVTVDDAVSAEQAASKSLALLTTTLHGMHPEIILARQALVRSYLQQQKFDLAQQAMDENRQQLEPTIDHQPSPLWVRTLLNQAEWHVQRQQANKALPYYQQALVLQQRDLPANHPNLAKTHHALSLLYQQEQGQDEVALSHANKACEILVMHQRLQYRFINQQHHDNGSDSALYKTIFITQLALLHAQKSLTLKQLEMTFQTLQYAQNPLRQQTLIHATLRRNTTNKQVQQQLRQLHAFKSRWQSLNQQRLASLSQPEAVAIQQQKTVNQQLAMVDDNIIKLDQQLRKALPHYAQLIQPSPVSLESVQHLLNPDEALLNFIIGEKHSFLLVITPHAPARLIALKSQQASLKKQLSRLRYALDFAPRTSKNGVLKPFNLALAADLYQQLLQPAEEALKDSKHLIFVTDDVLQNMPFATLVTQLNNKKNDHNKNSHDGYDSNYENAAWLIKRFSLSQLPAIHAFPLLRTAQYLTISEEKRSFIGFGDVALTRKTHQRLQLARLTRGMVADVNQLRQLPYLPDTKEELITLAQLLKSHQTDDLYLNERATETNIKQLSTTGQLARYRYLAFASHALLAKEAKMFNAPAEAGIVMTPPHVGNKKDDGYLSSSEILNLKLNADIVILSACNTANLTERNESGLSNLSKAFFLAGTRSILATQWAAHSYSSRALVVGLLQRISQQNTVINNAEALRQSMLEHLHRKPVCNSLCRARDWLHIEKAPQHAPYAHPAYWGAFVLIGDGV